MEGCLIPSDLLRTAEGDGHTDPEGSPLKNQVGEGVQDVNNLWGLNIV